MGTEEIYICQLSFSQQLTGIDSRVKVFTPGVTWEKLLPIDKPEVEGNRGHNRVLGVHRRLYMEQHDTNKVI